MRSQTDFLSSAQALTKGKRGTRGVDAEARVTTAAPETQPEATKFHVSTQGECKSSQLP